MATNAIRQSAVHGIGHDGPGNDPENPGILTGILLKFFGNPTNNVSGTVNNQQVGSVALPAINAAATGTITYTNNKIKATSRVFAQVRQTNTGDTPAGTVPAAGALAGLIVAA